MGRALGAAAAAAPDRRRDVDHGLWLPGDCRVAGVGDIVLLPKGVAHTWRAFGPDPIEMTVITTPGDFDRFFETIVDRNLQAPTDPAMAGIVEAVRGDFVGPPLSDDEVAAIRRGEQLG